MDEPSRKNNDGEVVTQQGNDSALRKIAAERRMPEGKGRMTELGFDCGLFNKQMHGPGSATLSHKYLYDSGNFCIVQDSTNDFQSF